MNKPQRVEIPKNLRLASMLSISITVTVSVSYTILSILGLVYCYQCDVGDIQSIGGADYFFNLIFRVYIQNDECNSTQVWANLTQPESVFVLNAITLCSSVICCGAAIAFMIVVLNEEKSQHLHLVTYLYIAACVASQVVDLTFATHFGMDYSYLTDVINLSSPGLGMNYERDLLRLGAFVLMTICLKGFVASAINCALLVLIVNYLVEYNKQLQKEEHSIHKLGALNAYDQPRRLDPWQPESQMVYRGPQVNPAYIEEMSTPPRSLTREPSRTDFSRSDSWKTANTGLPRPFSYLEEPKRSPGPAASRPAPPAEAPWGRDARGDWPPPVPAPDYSPHTPRRLKPALKPYI